jgi:lipopolysaccharide assembly protein A
MQFLKTVFWAGVAVIAAIFAYSNWTLVPIRIWGGLEIYTVLPFLLLIAFLLGLVPALLLHRVTRWSLKRKLESAERQLATTATPPPASAPKTPLPPAAAPIATPPGVS